ncbi:MAG TPA: hypothetical protein VEK79_22070 [Thermoanaerobaculia bacterium]|nr:hypothetical protein [Thermoanaerobaculia bacterium]
MRKLAIPCLLVALIACKREEPAPAVSAPAAQPTAAAPIVAPPECNASCPGSTCLDANTIKTAWTPPVDACPSEGGPGQFNVDAFSWNMFVALNWPANTTTCTPDQTKSILTSSPSDPVVWQTWSMDSEVFVAKGSSPKPWCVQDALQLDDIAKAEPEFAKLGADFLGISEPGTDVTQVLGTGVLTDQNGRWVRYQKLLNNTEYLYITEKNLWNVDGQKGVTVKLPPGSVEIKAAWKVLNDDEKASNRFYMTSATVYNTPDGETSPGTNPVTLGLVGLHIVASTPNFSRMLWATFEHVDNDTKWFHSATSTQTPNTQTAQSPYIELKPDGTPNNEPVQVTRVAAPGVPSSPAATDYYRALLKGSVWENYELVATQWGQGINPNGIPGIVANTVIETYIQPKSSCMGCHTNAKTTAGLSAGMSFLFREAK